MLVTYKWKLPRALFDQTLAKISYKMKNCNLLNAFVKALDEILTFFDP